ncbi:hypothetical protein BTR23_25210 [Alkalihalophilus pseudofirmus]|nr:hypothetical protein BTR23_25210 [Alkalihalophilus pseudofirmus]
MTFDFENWSEKLYQVSDKIDYAQPGYEKYDQELIELWEELLQHEDHYSVQFLTVLKSKLKDLVDGKVAENDYEQFVKDLRTDYLE